MSESSVKILERMRRQRLYPTIKRAADDAKASFEANFYKLTDALVSEHLPGIEKYDLGFQLIDKTKDNSKAFGVRAFRLRTLAFVPFFYDNGKVTGYELFYLPKTNIFVPTSPRWITYLKQQNTADFGESSDLKDFADFSSAPNLLPLRRPMSFKTAQWLKAAQTKRAYKKIVPKILKDPGCAGAFISLLDKYPFLVEKCAQVYGKDKLREMVKTAKAAVLSVSEQNIPKVAIPVEQQEKAAKVRFYGPFDDTFDLTIKEVDILKKTGFYVKDARDESEKSKVVPALMDQKLGIVGKPGLYTVLDTNLKERKLLVLPAADEPRIVTSFSKEPFPQYQGNWLIRDITAGFKNKFYRYNANLYYLEEHPEAEFRAFLERLPKVNFDELSENIRSNKINPSSDNLKLIIDPSNWHTYICWLDVVIIPSEWNRVLRKKEGDRTLLFVPKDAIQANYGHESPDLYATPELIFHWMNKTADYVKVYFDHGQFIINKKAFEKAAALKHLILNYGVSVKDGLRILRETQMHKQARYFIKRADKGLPHYLLQSEQPVVDMSGDVRVEFAPGYSAEVPFETERWIPGLKRPQPLVNIMQPPPEKIFNTLNRLSQANEGDVFDLGLLVSLIHSTRSADVVDSLVPQILKGLDGLGRVLFVLYRHKDKLKESYGNDDYNRIVDEVRTSFEQLGECIMDLVQDKIEPYVRGLESIETDVDLD